MQEHLRKYKRHIFVCVNEKDFGKHCCAFKGSKEILQMLRDHINNHGLMGTYNVTKSLCQGHCLVGPAIVIYPEGKTFINVTKEDVPKIIKEYLTP